MKKKIACINQLLFFRYTNLFLFFQKYEWPTAILLANCKIYLLKKKKLIKSKGTTKNRKF